MDMMATSLTDYVFEFHIAKLAEKQRNDRQTTFVQAGGIVYAGDIERDMTYGSNLVATWESLNLSRDQKIWRLAFYTSVIRQFMLKARPYRERAEHEAALLTARHNARIKRALEAPVREEEKRKKAAEKQAERERKAIEKAELKKAKEKVKVTARARKAAAKSASQPTTGQKRKRENTQLAEQITADRENPIL